MTAASILQGNATAARPVRPRAPSRWGTPLLLLLPTFVLMAYTFILPLASFFQYSFHRFRRGRLEDVFTLETYSRFLFDEYYHLIVFDTLRMAAIVTIASVLIGYPLAYALWRIERPSLQRWLGLLIFSPILVSVVVRSYGWTVLLSDQGPINFILTRLGILSGPATLVFNLTGVVISLTHVFLPFVVFPIYSTLRRLDPALKEAAEDLGAGWWTAFRRASLPLSLPGLVAGAQSCLTLALGAWEKPGMPGG